MHCINEIDRISHNDPKICHSASLLTVLVNHRHLTKYITVACGNTAVVGIYILVVLGVGG